MAIRVASFHLNRELPTTAGYRHVSLPFAYSFLLLYLQPIPIFILAAQTVVAADLSLSQISCGNAFPSFRGEYIVHVYVTSFREIVVM